MSRDSALLSLQNKIELEAELRKELGKINDKIVADYIIGGLVLGNYDVIIEEALNDHYVNVGEVFGSKISDHLPDDVEATNNEIESIAKALFLYFLIRSPVKREIIQKTTAKNIVEANDFGANYGRQQAALGSSATLQEQRIVAGNKLGQHLRNRAVTIAATETQDIAETSKAAEVSILMGQEPDFTVSNRRKLGIKKTWWTQGDEKVRRFGENDFDHVTADQQTVDVNQPFDVSGESLMYPGDTNLGASLGNIINCRCGTEYNINDIVSARR